jgi:hypothetical protein
VYTGVNDSYSEISAFRCPPLYCQVRLRLLFLSLLAPVVVLLQRCPLCLCDVQENNECSTGRKQYSENALCELSSRTPIASH